MNGGHHRAAKQKRRQETPEQGIYRTPLKYNQSELTFIFKRL